MTALKTSYRTAKEKQYIALYLDYKKLASNPENQSQAIIEHLKKKYEYKHASSVYYARSRGAELWATKNAR